MSPAEGGGSRARAASLCLSLSRAGATSAGPRRYEKASDVMEPQEMKDSETETADAVSKVRHRGGGGP
ncbi:uncharacterized protein TRAVEDRAFT_30863 [Trametes versicolor FP-101664 SS1]|uniref:uncharacterized protein n=1 Tax=Trametes versicolor (strain FP-101664) TaxID=717944 RepID=UPI0004622459|nr:uncharacterized protein TRAVEDRAFT_30863 [Trametes versicolor FP-101664 SS1]EIW54856.1 hypothetical protein TRAVEDRAFT_30863 [Trametes versicolor FP-101664 SS1]